MVHPNEANAPVRRDQVAIIYNGNGRTFLNGETTNTVKYSEVRDYDTIYIGNAYQEAMTSNVLQGGEQNGPYTDNENSLQTITVPGADMVKVVVDYAITGDTLALEVVEGAWDGDWGNLPDNYYEFYDSENISGASTYYFEGNQVTFYSESWDTPEEGYDKGFYAKIYPVYNTEQSNTTLEILPSDNCYITSVSGTYAEATNAKGSWYAKINGITVWFEDEEEIIAYIEENNVSLFGTTIIAYDSSRATLDTGQNVNRKLKRLAGNSSAIYNSEDTAITAIERSDTLPSGFIASDTNTISTSTMPVYAWFNNGTIYYYSEAEIIYLNSDSNNMFYNFRNLSDGTGLAGFDTSSVTNMYGMFSSAGYSATTFSLDLSSWDTSSVTDMSLMFSSAGYSAANFSLDLSGWDTSSVTTMYFIFNDAGYSATNWFVRGLSDWDVSSVTDMIKMFAYAGYSATNFSLDLSGWDTSSVTTMSDMFDDSGYNATTFSLNLSGWDTSSVTNMEAMFSDAGYGATTWSVSGLSDWNTSSLTRISSMFLNAGYNATTFSLDLSSWDTSSVVSMYQMFRSAGYNATTFSIDISGWNTSSVTSIGYMFLFSGQNATTWQVIIPQTNSNGVSNTTNRIYGKDSSYYATVSVRNFTLASGD